MRYVTSNESIKLQTRFHSFRLEIYQISIQLQRPLKIAVPIYQAIKVIMNNNHQMNSKIKENIDYLNKKVDPILKLVCRHLLQTKPADPLPHIIQFLQKQFDLAAAKSYSSESSNEEEDEVEELVQNRRKLIQKRGQGRGSISAQAFGSFNSLKEFLPILIPKSQEVRKQLKIILKRSFLFNTLQAKDLQTILDVIKPIIFQKGEWVIRQGEDGNQLYIVQSGQLQCTKIIQGKSVFLKKYYSGDFFGELALLYNVPRQASIHSLVQSKLWSLNRQAFNSIIKDSAIKKRQKYIKFLESIQILKEMDPYQRTRLSEVLISKNYQAGQIVIQQGDFGNDFFILEQGQLQAIKQMEDGSKVKVMSYKQPGSFFGQLALLKDIPRQASIVCVKNCKLLNMDRQTFGRMLGPLQHILQRKLNQYIGLKL